MNLTNSARANVGRMGRMNPNQRNPYAASNPTNVKAQASAELKKMQDAGLVTPDGKPTQQNLSRTARTYLKNLKAGATTGQRPQAGWAEKIRKEELEEERMRESVSNTHGGGVGAPVQVARNSRPMNVAQARQTKLMTGSGQQGTGIGAQVGFGPNRIR